MDRPTLLVDIDGVLADQGPRFRDLIREETGGRVDLRPEDCRDYDLARCVDAAGNRCTPEEWARVLERYASPFGTFSLPVIPGAEAALMWLSGHYRIAIVTGRQPALEAATRAWLGTWAGFPHTLHFVPRFRKHLPSALGLTPAAAIEDDYDQGVLFAAYGVPCHLYRQPWNDGKNPVPGLSWADDWPSLADRLIRAASAPRLDRPLD